MGVGCSVKEKRIMMVCKVLKKMEVLRGFIRIPAESRLELIGNTPLPCSTMLNDNPARIDKYGRLWSSYLKSRFSLGTQVELSKTENGYQVTPSVSKKEHFVSEMKQQVSVNKIIFGSCENMSELDNKSVHLVVTSPPYFNAPFDYPDLFKSYGQFLTLIRNVARELKRVLDEGRITCFVCDDTLIKGKKYPVVADIVKIFIKENFKYRDRIVWVKPEGYIRISRRSGVLIQHPYPMYYYPDNLQESILIFQNGDFNYSRIPKKKKEESKIDLEEWSKGKWYLSVWNITNVLPLNNRLEKGIAAFPEEIPYRLIKLFSYKGETVLDPFMGSGTTLKVAQELGRKCVGYEIDIELLEVVKEKLGIAQTRLFQRNSEFEIILREDARHLRTELQKRVKVHANKK